MHIQAQIFNFFYKRHLFEINCFMKLKSNGLTFPKEKFLLGKNGIYSTILTLLLGDL